MILKPIHLFAYAPHGVLCQVWQHIVGYKNRKLSFDTGHDFYNKLENGLVRIFLRPLSDLTKEIEVNGEKFIPIERLRSEFLNIYFEIGILSSLVIKGKNENFIIYSSTVLINSKLCEWHFDIFGLIDAGLAVDINTVKF